MTVTPEESWGIDRRTVLKSMGAATAAGLVGGVGFTGSALAGHVAGHPASDFDLYGIDHFSSPNRLVTFNSLDLDPSGGTTTVDSIELSQSVDVNTLAAHPFETGGVRPFYSTDLDTNRAFTIDPTDGTVAHFGTANPVLGGIAGSAIIVDGSNAPHWYGITHAGASPASTLFEIDLTDGSTTESGALHVVENGSTTPVTATHLGLGVNFQTNELWGVLGDPADATNSRVFRVVDVDTGEIEIVDDEAMTGGRSVGAALGPCASIMFAVREGNDLYGYDVDSQDEYAYGSLEYASGSLDFDSLAVPYGFDCEDCVECDADGALAKYEFDCVDTECVEYEDGECIEWECVERDFALEGDGDGEISYDAGSFVSKDGEADEPMSVTFETEYCELYVLVKSGQAFDVQGSDEIDGTLTVESASEDHAISFVEFYCTEADAEAAMDAFPSKGRGGGNDR